MLEGIDVSSYQGNIDWARVKKAGYAFAFIKASEGVGLTDRHFAANWRESRAKGLVTAAYHFYRPGEDPTVQAHHFLAVAPMAAGDLPPICDVEKAGASSPSRYGKDLRTWLSVVEAATGLKPIVYTSPGLWNGMVSGDFGAWPLWVAHYTSAAAPRLPNGWSQFAFWQYRSTGAVHGISGNVDRDRFDGDEAALQLLRKK